MMQATYEPTIGRALTAAHAIADSFAKAPSPTNPLSLSGPRGASVFDGQDAREDEEAYKHFRGEVYSAARVIINRVSGQPVMVARVTKGGKKSKPKKSLKSCYDAGTVKPDSVPSFVKAMDAANLDILETHEALDVLGDPNPLMVSYVLWYHTVANLLVTGRSYWFLSEETTEGENGKPGEKRKTITPLPSTWIVGRTKDAKSWLVKPATNSEAAPVPVPVGQMAYFYLPDPSDPWGVLSPLQMQARAILANEAIQQAQQVAFKNGIFPAVALIAGDAATADGMQQVQFEQAQRQQLTNWMRSEYAGVTKYGLPIILDALIKDIKVISNKPAEMAFTESGNYTKGQIYEGFGVNPISAGQVEGANRASSAIADGHLCSNAVNPIIELISQVMTQWLGPWFAKPGETLKIWLQAAEANDPEILLKRWEMARSTYAVTDDEFRAAVLSLPPLPNGEGAVIRRPAILMSTSDMEEPEEPIEDEPDDTEPPEDEDETEDDEEPVKARKAVKKKTRTKGIKDYG